MKRQDWTLEFYRDERGREPVSDFLRSLDPRMRDKVARGLDLLASEGDQLAMPHSRPVTGYRFWELRVQMAGNISRIFYFAFVNRRMILLHGFIKKDRKTPRAELDIAARRFNAFMARRSQ